MNVSIESNDDGFDKLMPMSMFRYLNPKRDIRCCLCHKAGMRIREGNLLAFRKGTRQVLVHTNCAENSPEVEVFEGQWKDVFTTVNRSRNFECVLCNQTGATIGCAHSSCDRCYHFSCGEDTGWRFEMDGKEFYCDLHRTVQRSGNESSFRVSMTYFQSKSKKEAACALCGIASDSAESAGELLAFQRRLLGEEELTVVHRNCIRNTSIIDIGEEKMSGIDHEYRNVFTAIDRARGYKCCSCMRPGASALCSEPSCSQCFHFLCAQDSGWNFKKRGAKFCCAKHREESFESEPQPGKGGAVSSLPSVQHKFSDGKDSTAYENATGSFSQGVTTVIGGAVDTEDDEDSDVPDCTVCMLDENNEETALMPSDITLAVGPTRGRDSLWIPMLVRITRKSIQDRWNVELFATCLEGSLARYLTVVSTVPNPVVQLEEGDIVRVINGVKVGSKELNLLSKVFSFLSKEVDVCLEIDRLRRQENPWI